MKKNIFILLVTFLLSGVGNRMDAQDSLMVFKGHVYHQDGTPFENALVSYTNKENKGQVATNNEGYYEVKYAKNSLFTISFPEHYAKRVFPVPGKSMVTILVSKDKFSVDRTYLDGVSETNIRTMMPSVSLIVPDDHLTVNETVDDLWRGAASGLYSAKQSGVPGAGSLNMMRGIHSLHTYKSPTIILDGMYIGDYMFTDPAITGNTLFTLLGVNPASVKEIVFLKDGASTLKYGVKGGNGVILINTRRADVDKTQIFAGFSTGISVFDGEIPMLNASQHRKYLQQQFFDLGFSPEEINPSLGSDADTGDYPRWDHDTNWQNELFKPAMRNNVNFSFSGGDEISKFYFALGYTGNAGTIENTRMDRLNARLNADVAISDKARLTTHIGFGYTNNQLFDNGIDYVSNPIYASLIKSPLLSVYEAVGNGLYQSSFDPEDNFGYSNPAAIISDVNEKRTNYFLAASFRFNYQFNNKLASTIMVGNNLNQLDDDVFIPDFAIGRLPGSEAEQTIRKQDDKSISWYSNAELSYNNLWSNKHSVSLHLGANLNSNTRTKGMGSALNTGSDDFQSIQFGDATTSRKDGLWIKDRWINGYFLADYNFKNKYFVGGGISIDGSSRFGNEFRGTGFVVGDNIYSVLYSCYAGYDLAQENTLLSNWFEVFKLRGGYSLRGNDMFDNYVAQSYYVPKQYYTITGLTKGGVMNRGISWESSENIEAGLDLAFIGEKVSIGANYFREDVDEVIAQNQLTGYYGFPTMLDNSAHVLMEGLEGSLRMTVFDKRKFSWETEIHITHSRSTIKSIQNSEIIEIPGGEKINRVDDAPFSFYGYNYQGAYSTDESAANAGLVDEFGRAFRAGDAIFEDSFKDGIIDSKDKQILGNPMPEIWGSWVNRLRVGQFGLYTSASFCYGAEVFNYTRSKLEGVDNFFNQTTHVTTAWAREGDVTTVARISAGDPMGNARFSSRWIEDGSFIRLNEVTLSYNFKLKNTGVQGLQLYASGKNLLVITDYLGYDPEFSYGLDVETMGVDYFSVPQNTSYLVGVKIDF